MPFAFQATRDLRRYLGEFDALSEMNELAVRDLLYRRDRLRRLNGKDCATAFIESKSRQHGICVNASVAERLAVGMAQTYVCAVWNCADGFLRDLRKEHQAITESSWRDDAREKTRLRFTLENLFSTEQKGVLAIGTHRHAVMEYCRLVRNRIAHPRSTSDKAVSESYDRVRRHVESIRAEYRMVDAPQPMANMTFEDAVLLSRVTKDVATILNEAARPAARHLLNSIDAKTFNRLNNNVRRRSAMIGALCTRCNGSQSYPAAQSSFLKLLPAKPGCNVRLPRRRMWMT